MEKEKLEGLLIDFIDGRLTEVEKIEVQKILDTDESARMLFAQLQRVTRAMDDAKDLEPGSRMRIRFQQMLLEEEQALNATKASGREKGRQVSFYPILTRVAAAFLLVAAGVSAGYWINKNQLHEEELQALRVQMLETKQMMMAMLDNQSSASQRIQGVNVAMGIEKADDEVVRALVKAMNEDSNTNVRLAALDALSVFHNEPGVRKALIESLSKQKDPVVQIALIQLMVKMKEKGVLKDLNRIIDDVQTIKAVKDEAYTGLLKLS